MACWSGLEVSGGMSCAVAGGKAVAVTGGKARGCGCW